MKILYRQSYPCPQCTEPIEAEITPFNLRESIEKTRIALDVAYTGFDNVLDHDLIDSYIFEINALQKRYEHLSDLAASQDVVPTSLRKHSSIRALIGHVFS